MSFVWWIFYRIFWFQPLSDRQCRVLDVLAQADGNGFSRDETLAMLGITTIPGKYRDIWTDVMQSLVDCSFVKCEVRGHDPCWYHQLNLTNKGRSMMMARHLFPKW